MQRAPTDVAFAAATLAAVSLAAVSAPRWSAGERPDPSPLVDAAFPAAMAALPDGGLVVGELSTGRVLHVDGGVTALLGTVPVSTEGEQRGLLGLAVRGNEIFVSFTAPSGRLQVRRLGGPMVWEGPPSADRSIGGRIAFAPDGSLVIGVGDLLDPEAAAAPATPNGKMLALDAGGPADQRPTTISSGWNNPFAFAFAPDGTLYVADNAGGAGDERLAIGNAGPSPVVLSTFPPHSVPSGLAITSDGLLAVCTYRTRTLRTYEVVGETAVPDLVPLATDCSLGVVALSDGRLAYANQTAIMTVG